MNEAGFRQYLTKHFRLNGAFVQTIEATTGSGIPDMYVAFFDERYGRDKARWIELKWGTEYIRPEQYVWDLNLRKTTKDRHYVTYLIGAKTTVKVMTTEHASPLKNRFKLIHNEGTYVRDSDGIENLVQDLSI